MKRILWILLVIFLSGLYNTATGFPIQKKQMKIPGFEGKDADTAWINFYINQGFLHLTKKDYDIEKVRAYIDTASLVCEKKSLDFPANLHFLEAEYYYEKGDFSRSETEAALAERKAEIAKDYSLQAKSLLFLGRYYHRTGFFQESIDNYNKSIVLSEEKNIKGIRQKSYDGQASVFISVGDLNAYVESLKKMIHVSLSEKDTLSAESGLLRLGTILTEDLRDFRLANTTLRECVRLALLSGNTYYTAHAMANLGWNFYRENMLDSSLFYYTRSLKFSLPSKHIGVSTNAFGNIGTIYRDLGKHEEAVKYYTKSLDQARMTKDWYSMSWIYKDMSALYLSRSDTSNAYQTYVLYKQFNDSVQANKNTTGLAEARIRYDADTHNKEIALLELRLKNNRIITVGYTVLILALVSIGLLLFRSNRLNTRRRISEMNHKISEMTQANLRQQMNPHFIFNTLNSIQYYMYQNDKVATNNYLTKFSSLMRKVLDNSQNTSVPLRDELDALKLYLELECLRFKDKFEFNITVDEELDTLMYKVPTMLIQPYVENSICHGLIPMEGKGYVNIDLKLSGKHIICTIKDNGIGREAAAEIRRQKGTNHNSLGTRITASRLDLVNSLYGTDLRTIYKDLKNEKGVSEGTLVEIHIPILT